MPRMRLPVSTLQRSAWLLVPSMVLGAAAGLFLYGYWLTDLPPIGDEQVKAATLLISLMAAAGYFVLLIWATSSMETIPFGTRCGLAAVGIPVAAFLLFGGTSNWMSPDRYIAFLLPVHRLQLTVAPASSARGSALVWFSTSLGDVSYSTITAQGWRRVGDQMIVEDPNSNSLSWIGRVGDRVQLVMSGSSSDVQVNLAWDGRPETTPLSGDKTNYSRAFPVPFYASKAAILVLGWLAFYGLALALVIFVWRRGGQLKRLAAQTAGNGGGSFGWIDVGFVVGAALLASLLRFFNLGGLYPAVDEYYHLIAAKQILQGVPLAQVYPRGLWIVTIPIVATFRLLGEHLWVARLPGAVFNVLALVPLYLLARRINRPVAVLACVLYATSPWIVSFARVAREYAYYPFYFYWIILAMVEFISGIPQRFVLVKQWRLLVRPKTLALAVALAVPPIFGLKIDWLSTFRTILIAYLVFAVFVLLRFDWSARPNWLVLAVLGVVIFAAGRAWYLEQSGKLQLLPQLNLLPIEYFLPNPQQQWYFNRVVLLVALGTLAVVVAAFWLRSLNFTPLFVLGLFVAYLTVFAFLSRIFFRTRHLLSTQLWYVIVVAMGLYAFWEMLVPLLPRITRGAKFALAVVVGLSVLNPGQVLVPVLSNNPDMPISEDYMHDMSRVQSFLLPQVSSTDVLVSTVYGQYAIWEGTPAFADQLHITSRTPVADILLYASQHEAGWIVIDEIRFKLASMSIKDLAGHEQIEYLGQFGDERVWHWDRTSSQAKLVAWSKRAR